MLVRETNLYAVRNHHPLNVTTNEFRTFIAILLRSGYVQLQNSKLYWCQDRDVLLEAPARYMRRDRFLAIMRNLHLVDKADMNEDRFFKVRSLFDYFNLKSKTFPLTKDLCVDEAMIRYFGSHGAKQYMRGKPTKFGFKCWCLGSTNAMVTFTTQSRTQVLKLTSDLMVLVKEVIL